MAGFRAIGLVWQVVAVLAAPAAVACSVAALAPRAPAPQPVAAAVPVERPAPVVAPAPPTPPPVVAEAPAPASVDEGFVIRRVLDIGGPIRFGEHFWDEEGVPPGPVVITVDLEAQTLSVFRGGYEIGAAAILYGDDAKPTPLGTFPITEKDADHISNIYNAPMPYMLRLTNDGISVHGTEVEWGYATHGCVGVPTEFARKLFAIASLGDKVIITRGKRIGVGDRIAA